jgi:hypothetical protein
MKMKNLLVLMLGIVLVSCSTSTNVEEVEGVETVDSTIVEVDTMVVDTVVVDTVE